MAVERVEPPQDVVAYLLDAELAVDLLQLVLRAVVVDQRRGIAEEDVDPAGGNRGVVVRAVEEAAAMDEPVDQRLAPHLQVDDLLDPLAEIGQHPVQRLGLRYGARKPVQDDAAGGTRLAQAP